MVSNGKNATIAAALAAAISVNAVSAGADVPQGGQAYAQNDTNVVRMVPVNASVATCPISDKIQTGFKPQQNTTAEFLDIVLAPMFKKQCKNAVILFSDKPPEQNDPMIQQLAGVLHELKSEMKRQGKPDAQIDYIMQVYRGGAYKNAKGEQVAPPAEGTMSIYMRGYPISETAVLPFKPLKSVGDVLDTVKAIAPFLNDAENGQVKYYDWRLQQIQKERRRLDDKGRVLDEVDDLLKKGKKTTSVSDGKSSSTASSGMPELPDPFA